MQQTKEPAAGFCGLSTCFIPWPHLHQRGRGSLVNLDEGTSLRAALMALRQRRDACDRAIAALESLIADGALSGAQAEDSPCAPV